MANDQVFRFDVTGLNCAGCAGRAERAIAKLNGVDEASVNFATSSAYVSAHDISAGQVADALRDAGYPAREQDLTLSVNGLSCAACVGRAERTLLAQPETISASVNLATKTAHVRVLASDGVPQKIARVLTDAGYPASLDAEGGLSDRDYEVIAARRVFLIAAVFTLPVFVMEMGGHIFPAFHHWLAMTVGQTLSWSIQFILTSIVMIWPGRQFYQIGLPALMRGAPEMNSLVALGTLAAWSFSTVALFLPTLLPAATRAVYFEAAAVIITLILLGRWLEARAKGQTGAAIRALSELRPDTAMVVENGMPREIPIDAITPGDLLMARAGDRIAVDGQVADGSSHVDESMISGEPLPVAKSPGDQVVGGTINQSGTITYKATKVGADTVLAQIISLVRDAQAAKLPIQQMADKVVRIFVPVVIAIATVTVIAWLVFGASPKLPLALVTGVSVLIIACPCAMGLATPTSIMVGTGRAAQLGVLFRKGDALQTLSSVKLVAFDKTGTLTLGQPRVVSTKGDSNALAYAAALEAQSSHPLAKAITDVVERPYAVASNVETVPGYGLSGIVDGRKVAIGNSGMMAKSGIKMEADDHFGPMEHADHTPVYVAIDGSLKARLSIADPLKPGAKDLIDHLHGIGIKTALVTGDTQNTANAIAARIGIDDVRAGILPEGKADAVRELQNRHGPLAFVGDGINDAPALATADVGLAMGSGTDVAIESADVVLSSENLSTITDGITVSKATLSNIRQNLGWAFGYNIILIPVAAGVFYPVTGWLLSPMLAAGAMALSSVFVVTNALRLKGIKATELEVVE